MALAQPAVAATFTVNTTADHVEDKFCNAPPAGDCTLRDAVSLAGTNDTINVPAGTYTLLGSLGELSLVADHIVGANARTTVIQAEKSRVLLALSGASTVAGVTIRNGNGDSTVSTGAGGGVFVAAEATLIFSNSTISGNTATSGGGIAGSGGIGLIASTVAGNQASAGRLTRGGGIAAAGALAMTNSTVSGNTAVDGTGSASTGGGVYAAAGMLLTNVTIAGNSAAQGGGIYLNPTAAGAPPAQTWSDTLVGVNTGGGCGGPGLATDTTHNNLGPDQCLFSGTGDVINANPGIGALGNNGGPTDTHALPPGTAAVDKGATCATTDQRGFTRAGNGAACDIGAYEYRPPKLTVTTSVVNNNGGTLAPGNFSVHVLIDKTDVSGSPQPGSATGTTYTLAPGTTYTVTANGVTGYARSVGGDCAANGNVTLQEGDVKACQVTEDDIAPTLKVTTTVTNNNGGTLTPAAVLAHVRLNGADVSGSPAAGTANGTTYTLSAGTYNVAANAVSGYTLTVGGDCAANGNVVLALADAKACTITADDIAPTLQVTTSVTNNNGGTLTPAGVSAHVRLNGTDVSGSPATGSTTGTTYTLSAGTYNVAANAVTGYTLTVAGDCAANGNVTLAVGNAKACTITADDIAPTLKVTMSVTNNDGGTLAPADMLAHVRLNGADVSGSPQAGSTTGTTYTLSVGAYNVAADSVTGYTLTVAGDCAANGNVALAVGNAKACTITADDVAPKLTVVTQVVNDNGGTRTPASITARVTGTSTNLSGPGSTTGTTYTLVAGRQYAVAADAVTGYTQLVSDGCASLTLTLAQNRTCTITLNDIQPVLTVRLLVDDNGTGQNDAPDAFTVHISQGATEVGSGPGDGTGRDFPLNAGSYAVDADGPAGYSSVVTDACAPSGTVALAVGDRKTCTITKIAGSPTLKVVSAVINDNGGTATPANFNMHVKRSGADVVGSPQPGAAAGTDFLVPVGTYAVSSSGPAGYTTTYSGDCSGGNVSVAVGESKSCTVTQNDVAPTLTVVTNVVNDNGGTRAPAGFTVHVRKGAADVSGSPKPGNAAGTKYTLAAGSYAVAADAVTGYTVTGCSVTLAVGDAKTCTVSANDTVVSGGPLPPPLIYKSVNLLPSSGKVLVKTPGTKKFVLIDDGQQVPLGTIVDVRKGRVTLIAAADSKGGVAQAVFYGGIFKLGQTKAKTPVTVLSLVEKLTGCKATGKASIAKKKVKKRRLWGDGKGRFQTKGKRSAATVVGTKWMVEDRCTSTLTKVARGRVKVTDFAKHKTVFVKAGKKYVARGR